MGLFSKKNMASLPVDSPRALPVVNQQWLWAKTVDNAEIEEICQTILTHLAKAAFQFKNERENSENLVKEFLGKIKQVDRQALANDYYTNLFVDNLTFKLPRLISTLRTELLDEDDKDYATETFNEEIFSLIRNVDSLPQILAPSRQAKVTAPVIRELKLEDSLADSRLKEIDSLILAVGAMQLSVEDRFTVEQVAASYLPDALRLYAGLNGAAEQIRSQATDIFLQQLTLIENQLQTILDKGAKHSLEQMKAHLSFLESKNDSSLALEGPAS